MKLKFANDVHYMALPMPTDSDDAKAICNDRDLPRGHCARFVHDIHFAACFELSKMSLNGFLHAVL